MVRLFRKKYPFQEAIEELRKGKRIRRAYEVKGYAKINGSSSHFFTYWVDEDKTSTFCVFTLDDVLADDWIID
jgi:hypothetical protein